MGMVERVVRDLLVVSLSHGKGANIMTIDYDKQFDVLYIALGDMSNSIGCESYGGMTVMRDDNTREITGVTLFGFARRYFGEVEEEEPDECDLRLLEECANDDPHDTATLDELKQGLGLTLEEHPPSDQRFASFVEFIEHRKPKPIGGGSGCCSPRVGGGGCVGYIARCRQCSAYPIVGGAGGSGGKGGQQ